MQLIELTLDLAQTFYRVIQSDALFGCKYYGMCSTSRHRFVKIAERFHCRMVSLTPNV